jgi:MFS family permease
VERHRWWSLGELAFSVLIIVLDNSVLNVVLPAIVRQLHASSSQLQWMVDAYRENEARDDFGDRW